MTASTLTVELIDAVRPGLADLGFKKRSGEIFTAELADGVLGWLGLNRAYRRGEDRMEVNPVVGVRHQEVERLVAELSDEPFHPYIPPTVSTPLVYLPPGGQYEPWLFGHGEPAGPAASLVAAVRDSGLPFMATAVSLDGLRRQIEAGMGFAHQLVYRLPVVCLLAGDRAAGRQALDASVAELGDRQDPAAVELRAFAERLRTRLAY